MSRLLRLFPLLALCACTSLRGKADDLAEKGQYLEAAALYDTLIRDNPDDATLVATRDDLRRKGLEMLLGRARRFRFEGRDEEAEAHLERFLAHRLQWNSKLSGALESSLLDEMEGTHRHLRQLIIAPARRGWALTAEAHLDRKRALLAHAEMAPIRRDVEPPVLQAGKATCARLKKVPTEGSPHWTELVSRYCRRWQERAPEPPPLPEVLGVPAWTVGIDGASPAQHEHLRALLARAFEASPWYSPLATRQTAFAVHGRFDVRTSREPVRLTASWMDKEPYTDHEERVEKVQEPYEAEETYEEQGEKKKRKVTKYRTREHRYTVPVTKYREVPREFDYHALRHAVDFRLSLACAGELAPGRSPLSVGVTDQLSEHGYEHDTTFAPGDVRPSRAKLPQSHPWFERQARELERAFTSQLTALWRQYYCSTPALSLEEAARCARAGLEVPPAGRQALAEVLEEDAGRAHVLFAAP